MTPVSAMIAFVLIPNDARDAVHLHSPGLEHDTDARDCWCHPTFYRVCDDCEAGCWKCANGKHILTAEEAEFCADIVLVVHRL
jgi:uncharacterized cupin superfamily protein